MTKKTILTSITAVCTLLLAAIIPTAAQKQSPAESSMRLSVVSGSEWKSTMKAGILTITKVPQYACWIASEDGTLIRTLQSSSRTAHSRQNISCAV